jgi:hypothetical protein
MGNKQNQNQNQSGIAEHISATVRSNDQLISTQKQNLNLCTLRTLVVQLERADTPLKSMHVCVKDGGDGPDKYMLQPWSALAQG